MTSTPRSIGLFVVKKAGSSVRWLGRLVVTFLNHLCLAVLRVIITSVVFSACVWAMLHYLGVPMPAPAELLDKLEDVGRLARILS
jgi:hypothetical protein